MEGNRNSLAALARTIELQRQDELRSEERERREFRALGLDYDAVQQARRLAAQQQLNELAARAQDPYQLSLPGMNPTLMALRSAEPLTPAEMQAAGIRAPWRRSPMPVGTQLELDLNQAAPRAVGQAVAAGPANAIVRLVPPATQGSGVPAGDRFAGQRLARVLGGSALGGGALLGALMQLLATEGEEAPESRG